MKNLIEIEVHSLTEVTPVIPMRTNLRLGLKVEIDEFQFATMIIKAFEGWGDEALKIINEKLKTENFILVHDENLTKMKME